MRTCSHSLLCSLSKTHRFRSRSAQWRSPSFGFSRSPLPLSHYAKLHPQHVPAFINVASKVLGALAHLPPPPTNRSLQHPHFIPRPHCLLTYFSPSSPPAQTLPFSNFFSCDLLSYFTGEARFLSHLNFSFTPDVRQTGWQTWGASVV